MKSPDQLRTRLSKQWHSAQLRVERLLNPGAWPLRLPISRPSAQQFCHEPARIQQHTCQWQQVREGQVHWQQVAYRAGASAIALPHCWELRSPSEWVAASADKTIQREFAQLEAFVAATERIYWERLIRHRALWRDKPTQAVIEAARLASALTPGCARGKPLRLLADYSIDTKFFERHERLITVLLDERFAGAVSEQGLANFLDAPEEKEHWLLLAPLVEGLLPFTRQRVPSSELSITALSASHLLIVENEQCLHRLPPLSNTIALLGAGLNLSWLQADWLREKTIGYWGDMDTWGLLMLARARQQQPHLTALLMEQTLFERYAAKNAVAEPTIAQQNAPDALTKSEQRFYRYLTNQPRGRLEQEFLPETEVHQALRLWQASSETISQ